MRFRLASCLSLAGLGLLLVPRGCEADGSLAWQAQSEEDTDSDYKPCWVFNHMNKSGGQTVKGLLKTWIARNRISPGLYDSLEWKGGAEQAKSFLNMDHTLIWGAYAEGLRPFGVPAHCKWFTIFRHPVSRLVSAYYFCQRRFLDPLCAADVVRADEVDLLTFAQHWTNFGLRQFASAFVLPEDVMSSRLAQRCPDCPGWYLLRAHLDERYEQHMHHTRSTPDAAMYQLLEPAQVVLENEYAAVGILERYNTTLHLFDAALQMPGVKWPLAFKKSGMVNQDKLFRVDIERAIEKAMTDVKIKKYLQLDLLLYEHAVAVHIAQAEKYGLGEVAVEA